MNVLLRSASVLALAACALAAQAQLAQYTFPTSGDPSAPTTAASSISASNITSPKNLTYNPATAPGTLGINYTVTTPAQSLANDAYFAFTLAPTATNSMSLASFQFDAAKGGGSNPRGVFVRTSLDGFSSDVYSTLLTSVQPNLITYTAPLGSSFQALTRAVTFRIYGYVQDASGGQALVFDNVTVNGTVQATPEPSALAALSLGALALLKRRKRA